MPEHVPAALQPQPVQAFAAPFEHIEPDSSIARQRFTLKSLVQVGLPLGTAVGRGVGPAVVLTTGAGVGLGVGRADGAGVGGRLLIPGLS